MDERATAKLTGKSLKTIQHWAREGVRIYDEASLLEHSEMCDARSRGSSRNRIARRLDDAADRHPNLTSFFPVNIAPEAFVDLPAPVQTRRQAENADAAILDLQTASQERLFALKAVGHNGSVELAESVLWQSA